MCYSKKRFLPSWPTVEKTGFSIRVTDMSEHNSVRWFGLVFLHNIPLEQQFPTLLEFCVLRYPCGIGIYRVCFAVLSCVVLGYSRRYYICFQIQLNDSSLGFVASNFLPRLAVHTSLAYNNLGSVILFLKWVILLRDLVENYSGCSTKLMRCISSFSHMTIIELF